ncbi:MAG: DNA gyrase inhibitor YacG [Tepidiphilus sp.]|jgi:endogenous inhibitor of DNA gyrase (YacG/DUF329 family)|uniref:DNA gyrase inhibitor YacG n=1 Tax=Tepidiphilus thermophilus TaxID=876478 RepID=A0A0K6IP92_9PROT|nr:DNA gyrase inhibitor YacG [Tepidiphilus thermophilus]MBP6999477.1 DNA gyrase inhibitor YacG [Tepidiphilus sp.]MDD2408390.1 DNA gyrase inhibitor YacG [Tepidiphilus sp.]MDD3433670.1 DNA gyrase inhibitor YacG [Tepidiphilus sp.]MDK2797510.1 uncharacterized protein [Tepidiphilus sp.]CUB04916.1 Endogenous inhibitor of DNA gyrase, YacG/DUF329 family [Tepidiphilus thermophilus]
MNDAPPKPPRLVSCPTCGKPVPWTPESRWRPFCSERCKLIDLGAWADERYRLSSDEKTPPESGNESQ